MAQISISVDTAAAQALLARAPQALDRAIEGSLNDTATYMLARVKHYPPQRPNSSYIRTKTLFRSWSMRPITRTAGGWQVVVGSNGLIAPYNRYVQDRTRIAAIHVGRWETVQDITEQSTARVQRFVDARVRAAMGSL